MAEQASCAHEGCKCDVPKDRAARGDAFCSEYCAHHGEHEEHAVHECSCGHILCAA